jgi:hypothetical protein
MLMLGAVVVLPATQAAEPVKATQPDKGPAGALTAATAPDSPKATVAVEAEKFATIKDATVKDDTKASGGKALLMDKESSKIETTVDLPAGKFRLVLIGASPDDEHDALNVTVAPVDAKSTLRKAEARVIFDAEKDGYAADPGADKIDLDLAAATKVKLTIKVADEKGMRVDRAEFQPAK